MAAFARFAQTSFGKRNSAASAKHSFVKYVLTDGCPEIHLVPLAVMISRLKKFTEE
jgi:hypothetical protein